MDVRHPPEPCSGTVSRLRNLYPRSIKNIDAISSINFPNPSVSYPFTLLFNLVKTISIILLEYWDDAVTVTVTVIVYMVNSNKNSEQ